MNNWRRAAPGGDVDHPNVKGTNPDGINGKMKNLKHLWKMNLLRLRQVHSPGRCGKKRWHHHQSHHHKMCSHLGLHRWDQMMHPRNEGLLYSQVLSGGPKNPNPYREVTSVVIHIYFLALHKLFFTLAYLLFYISIAFKKISSLLHYKLLSPMWMIPRCIKTHTDIHCGGIKIKNTMHVYFFLHCKKIISENPKILDRHLARTLPIRKYI